MQPGNLARIDFVVRTDRSVEGPPRHRVHRAGVGGVDRRPGDGRAAAPRGGRAARRVARRRLRGDRGPRRHDRRAPQRPRAARRCLPARSRPPLDGTVHDPDRELRRPVRRLRTHRRDSLDRAGGRRLGRLLHDHEPAVARLPRAGGARRSRRRRGAGALLHARAAAARGVRVHPFLDAETCGRGRHRASDAAAHSRGADRHRRDGAGLRAVPRARGVRPGSGRSRRATAAALPARSGGAASVHTRTATRRARGAVDLAAGAVGRGR